MKFKIDENLPIEVAEILVNAGHDAVTVWDEHLVGASDTAIAAACLEEKRLMIFLVKI